MTIKISRSTIRAPLLGILPEELELGVEPDEIDLDLCRCLRLLTPARGSLPCMKVEAARRPRTVSRVHIPAGGAEHAVGDCAAAGSPYGHRLRRLPLTHRWSLQNG
jgi:hypothetical protein